MTELAAAAAAAAIALVVLGLAALYLGVAAALLRRIAARLDGETTSAGDDNREKDE